MKKFIFALLFLFSWGKISFAQKFQIIENEYITDSYLVNGIIVMKTRLITPKHRIIQVDFDDPYAPWYHVKLIKSSIPINYSEGKIQIDLKDVNKENHKLVLTFSDSKDLCQTSDTIDLPYVTNIILNTKKFIVGQENIISYEVQLNTGKIVSNSYTIIDKVELCTCNETNFTFKNQLLTPNFDLKKNKLNNKLCLKQKKTGEIVFNENVELTFKDNAYINFSGKNGVSGKKGIDGTFNSRNGTPGQNGENGENAPNVTVFVDFIVFNNDTILQVQAFGTNGQYFNDFASKNASIKILANGGHGGNGANGGNGDDLVSYSEENGNSVYRKAGSGGNGGNGGSGGNGGGIIVYSYQNISEEKLSFENKGGNAGNIGKYGENGNAYSTGMNDNTGGSSGSDGTNGKNGNLAKLLKLNKEEYDKLYQEKIKKMFD